MPHAYILSKHTNTAESKGLHICNHLKKHLKERTCSNPVHRMLGVVDQKLMFTQSLHSLGPVSYRQSLQEKIFIAVICL